MDKSGRGVDLPDSLKINKMSEIRKLTVAIETLGCRLNQYESDGLIQKFLATERYAALPSVEDGPDIAILNTCTVTDQADGRNRAAVRRIRRANPAARVVLTGCYAQTDPEKARALPGVDLVVGNDRKAGLLEIIERFLAQAENPAARAPAPTAPARGGPARAARPVLENPFGYGAVLPFGHTRAYLKIQDGCDRNCSYCKIPFARGRGVSRPLAEILNELARLEDRGVPEVVLTGVNLGWFRDGDLRFSALLERMLKSLSRMRLRLSSIEPCDVDARLGELSTHPLFCDFLHVPLQSGSREILKRMRRTYNPLSFRKRIEAVYRHNPGLFLGTDVIVGFPGESDADFADTLALCGDLGMAGIHAFRFSPRAGTEAAEFPPRSRVDDRIVRERMGRLLALKQAGWQAYAGAQLGRTRPAVVEHARGPGGMALTDNFLRLVVDPTRDLAGGEPLRPGQLRNFRLLRFIDDSERILAEPVYP